MVSTFHETQSFTYSSAIYKCNLHDRMPEWSRVRDIGDQTLFVSKHFNENFSETSVSKYKENKIYMSEPLYGDPYDLVHRLEIVDIATGTSEVKLVQKKMQGSEALDWIRPNLWKGGTLMFFKGLLLQILILGQARLECFSLLHTSSGQNNLIYATFSYYY